MAECSDESGWFSFFWRIENASAWLKGFPVSHVRATSPKFRIQSLSNTTWYTILYENGVFRFCRDSSDEGPDVMRVRWKASILKEGGSDVTSGVQTHVFKRQGKDSIHFGVDIFDFVDGRDDMRLRLCVSRQKITINRHQNGASGVFSKLLGIFSFLGKNDLPASTIDDAFPLECCGVTVLAGKTVSVLLDSSFLNILKTEKELSTVVASASGFDPIFHIQCSTDENSEYATIRINPSPDWTKTRSWVHVMCDISFENAKNKIFRHTIGRLTFTNETDEITFSHFVRKSELVPDDGEIPTERSLRLSITTTEKSHGWIKETNYSNMEGKRKHRPLPSMKHKVLRLYESQQYCDVTLEMDDGTLKAHKTVLEAWSEVFAAELNSSTVERDSKTVRIEDVDKATMEAFLRFLYTDSVEGLDQQKAVDLYFAADKYRVLPLRDVCSDFLEEHLSADNVCEVLSLAERHWDEGLKKAVISFLFAHRDYYFDNKEWKLFSSDNYKLALDVLESVCKISLKNALAN